MGVKSIRLNKNEEKALNVLKDHFNCDSSTIIKKSLWEMYENINDSKAVEEFEKIETQDKVKFNSFDDLF